jgi:hypothetical protein
MYENSFEDVCIQKGGEWVTYNHNFDNSINGLMFLFILTTQENWPPLAYQGVDCDEENRGPIKDGKWYFAYYFIVFLFVGSMFLLNLFVGVMFLNFTKVQKATTSSFEDILITEDQLNWIEVQRMIIKAKPNYNIQTLPPEYNWRKPIHKFITSAPFNIFISVMILLNMIQMSMLYNDAPDNYLSMLSLMSYIFTGIFTVELALRLIAYASDFWFGIWNIFDLINVIAGWTDLFYNVFTEGDTLLGVAPPLLRLLRILRITRLPRLFKNHKKLQDVMEIIQLCLPSMFNVFALLALILFIFSILGCYLFENGKKGNAINDFYNFDNFGSSIALALKIATGEDWNYFMYDYAHTTNSCTAGVGCGNAIAYLYFFAFEFIITFIMLNLFVLVVLELFDKFYFADDNVISQYKDEYQRFEANWFKIGATHSGFMIPESKLLRFFTRLTGPTGLEGIDVDNRAKEIILMEIRR